MFAEELTAKLPDHID
jgi:4-aminobutyrate aminotransferase-like enzyme